MTKQTLTVEIPAEFVINTNKAGEMKVNVSAMVESDTFRNLVAFGIAEKFNNAASGKNGDDAVSAITGQRDALNAGQVNRPRGGGASLDPVFKQARETLVSAINTKATKDEKVKVSDFRTWDDIQVRCKDEKTFEGLREASRKAVEAAAAFTL